MLRILVKKQLAEVFKSYFYDAKKNRMRSKLAIAGWIRYLLGVDDEGNAMPLSGDPLLEELRGLLAGIELGKPETCGDKLNPILSNAMIFGSDLTRTPLAARIEEYFRGETAGTGAVRTTLRKYLD